LIIKTSPAATLPGLAHYHRAGILFRDDDAERDACLRDGFERNGAAAECFGRTRGRPGSEAERPGGATWTVQVAMALEVCAILDQLLYRLLVAYRRLRSAATGETGLSVLLESS
jgi:hypothetical protein